MNNNETPPPLSAFTNIPRINVKVLDELKNLYGDDFNAGLDKNNIALLPSTTYEDITYDYTDKEIKEIVKGNAYLSKHKFPVIIGFNFPYKKKAYEVSLQIFKSLDEMKDFINNNKGIVIYKMFKRRDGTRYGMRTFNGLKFCCRLEYWYNNLLFKLNPFVWNIKRLKWKINTIFS
jgi:hypothetical protein